MESVLGRNLIWEYLLGPVLGPFGSLLRQHIAINEANQSFAHIHRFIAECNKSLVKHLPAGLLNSAGLQAPERDTVGVEQVFVECGLRPSCQAVH